MLSKFASSLCNWFFKGPPVLAGHLSRIFCPWTLSQILNFTWPCHVNLNMVIFYIYTERLFSFFFAYRTTLVYLFDSMYLHFIFSKNRRFKPFLIYRGYIYRLLFKTLSERNFELRFLSLFKQKLPIFPIDISCQRFIQGFTLSFKITNNVLRYNSAEYFSQTLFPKKF